MDGVHRYQRPDDEVEFDPTRTRLNGDAERVTLSKFGGGFTRFQSVYQRYSPGFEINDLGFQSRADEQMLRNWFALQFNKPTKAFTRAFFNFNTMQKWTTEGLPTTIGLNTNWHVQFPNWMWGPLRVEHQRIHEDLRRSRRARWSRNPPVIEHRSVDGSRDGQQESLEREHIRRRMGRRRRTFARLVGRAGWTVPSLEPVQRVSRDELQQVDQ
jgi:hypothetical protein